MEFVLIRQSTCAHGITITLYILDALNSCCTLRGPTIDCKNKGLIVFQYRMVVELEVATASNKVNMVASCKTIQSQWHRVV